MDESTAAVCMEMVVQSARQKRKGHASYRASVVRRQVMTVHAVEYMPERVFNRNLTYATSTRKWIGELFAFNQTMEKKIDPLDRQILTRLSQSGRNV